MINVKVMGEEVKVKDDITFGELSENYKNKFKSQILLAKANNQIKELSDKVEDNTDIVFFDYTHVEGFRVYTRALSMILIKAAKDVFGKECDIVIENSLKKNLYCEFVDKIIPATDENLNKIEQRMREIISLDLPIKKESFSKYKAIEKVKEMGMYDKERLFRFRRASHINLYSIDGFYDYYYGYMPLRTGGLDKFGLMKYKRGFLLLFPTANDDIPKELSLEKITDVFMEQMEWCRLMKVKDVAELNDIICEGKFEDLIRINEALHEEKIVSIVDMICNKRDKIKMVLIAGPSSSGKTTFAQRLCVQLRVKGITPHAISLDDYFINREDTPVDEFGKHDFENINALDLKLFNEHMTKMINGQKVELPYYNFITGKREYRGNFKQLNDGEIFVIEGIHGLNDKLTESIPNDNKFKIFVSAMTQLNVDTHNRISTSDSRLIRRIVRDYNFRGNDAKSTIDSWEYVARGEDKNIFPFQENADVIFNSATIYELAVLKMYIEPLLFKIDPSMPEFITANRLIKFLDYFLCADSHSIPNNSIIKEFVGGSCFDV